MANYRVRKTWEEFWGELLFVRFHENNPRLWELNDKRAQWVLEKCPGHERPRILDLGCGNGVLDVFLARAGAQVTAVDRMESVLRHARRLDGAKAINYVRHDLKLLSLPPASFDIILIFGLMGLMSKADDSNLIAGARQWVALDGQVLVDCQLGPDELDLHWSREFSDGILDFSAKYDPQTHLMQMEPTFQASTGAVIELYDPYDVDKPTLTGICRYLYPQEELAGVLATNGFVVGASSHVFDDDYLLIGEIGPLER